MNWKHWIKGLIGGFIGGAATAFTMTVVDPATFNFAGGLDKLWHVALVAGLFNIAMYLKQSPLPPDNDSTPKAGTIAGLLMVAMLCFGCSHLKSTTVESTDAKGEIISRKTVVTVNTFFDAKSELTKFKNTTTGKTMGTSIGSASAESSGSNTVSLVQAIATGASEGAARALLGGGVPALPAPR